MADKFCAVELQSDANQKDHGKAVLFTLNIFVYLGKSPICLCLFPAKKILDLPVAESITPHEHRIFVLKESDFLARFLWLLKSSFRCVAG